MNIHDDYFGLCPVCKERGVRVDYFKNHWFVCKEHRLRWLIGSGLFTQQIYCFEHLHGEATALRMHEDNVKLLEQCREVKPFGWPPWPEEDQVDE